MNARAFICAFIMLKARVHNETARVHRRVHNEKARVHCAFTSRAFIAGGSLNLNLNGQRGKGGARGRPAAPGRPDGQRTTSTEAAETAQIKHTGRVDCVPVERPAERCPDQHTASAQTTFRSEYDLATHTRDQLTRADYSRDAALAGSLTSLWIGAIFRIFAESLHCFGFAPLRAHTL